MKKGRKNRFISAEYSVEFPCSYFCYILHLHTQVRSTDVANGCKEDVDTALLKLYAEQDHDSLLDLLASENACLLSDCVPCLEKYHKCVYIHFWCVF